MSRNAAAKPTQWCSRWSYETGQTRARVAPNPGNMPGAGPMMIPADAAWESVAQISQSACWIVAIEANIGSQEGLPQSLWCCAYDVVPNEWSVNLAKNDALGKARYSWGPIAQLGLLVREPQELLAIEGEGEDGEQLMGYPFDNGVLIVLSSTPVVPTYVDVKGMALSVRGKR